MSYTVAASPQQGVLIPQSSMEYPSDPKLSQQVRQHSKRTQQKDSDRRSPTSAERTARTLRRSRRPSHLGEEVGALRRDKDVSVLARQDKHDAVRPSEPGLHGIFSTAPRRIDVRHGELFKHLQGYAVRG